MSEQFKLLNARFNRRFTDREAFDGASTNRVKHVRKCRGHRCFYVKKADAMAFKRCARCVRVGTASLYCKSHEAYAHPLPAVNVLNDQDLDDLMQVDA